ncbi:Conserved_hypothetical protein [Hexamita inflata]|uniref:Uncharacterized protein n=1 Tax=Hexamita inflata TaxID=28002 RepID=A0AA86QB49_9EUKA|nr:Conserved hypothetical protein [Hexamita inflata]CAI9948875.1 Conserved hypothetical protein [Hexamita inflata]
MLTRQQQQQFNQVLHMLIQQITGKQITSLQQLYEETTKLEYANRKGLWKQIAAQIGATQLQVHDYFFNTWALQFYEDVNIYRSHLKEIFQNACLQTQNYKVAIQISMQNFQKQFPNNKVNERKLYQVLYQYVKVQVNVYLGVHKESKKSKGVKQQLKGDM